jgi:hypothetical protein
VLCACRLDLSPTRPHDIPLEIDLTSPYYARSIAAPGRSFPLRCFEGIAALPGVRLISLQKYEGMEQLGALPGGMKIETLGEDFDAPPHAFVDSAAVMQS